MTILSSLNSILQIHTQVIKNESTAFHVLFFQNTIIFKASPFELILMAHRSSMFFMHVNVVVQFYPRFKFYDLLFKNHYRVTIYHTLLYP